MYSPVVIKEGPLFRFADGAEYRTSAPVSQMVIACTQLDRTEIGQIHRTVERISVRNALGHPTVTIQETCTGSHHLGKKTGYAGNRIQTFCSSIQLFASAKGNLTENFIVDIINSL